MPVNIPTCTSLHTLLAVPWFDNVAACYSRLDSIGSVLHLTVSVNLLPYIETLLILHGRMDYVSFSLSFSI